MIIKVIGIVLVFLSSSAIGFCIGESYCARQRELLNMADAVEMMSAEVMYTSESLGHVIESITPNVRGVCRELFDCIIEQTRLDIPLKTAWETAIELTAPAMSLKKSDEAYLVNSSHLLTAYELEDQRKHLSELKEKIGFLADEALSEKNKNARLVKMLGVYGGALLCVIIF